MKKLLHFVWVILLISYGCSGEKTGQKSTKTLVDGEEITISKAELKDKIKGGWAGQVIGCTYGGPTEFRFNGTMIQEYQPIPWYDGYIKSWYDNAPGLYDDIYMDLTFVEVFEKEGLDAPALSHAKAFANAEYMLWHANQAARYNILNGINPPESGHWTNNPHADDIDFQIEADFAGLMSPGMINSATGICDKIGHIMNYGDGWYGGVYVASMYSLTFVSDDMEHIVKEALKTIPVESQFYQCIHDVIGWYYQNPGDWKTTWFEVEKKWSSDIGCPDGVFRAFDIDAKINAAYIVIGLLYGKGDFGKTVDISTRCGQDSDCNPASAGGILGAVLGYSNIPGYWKMGLPEVEDLDFKYTTISLNDVYEMGYKHALQMVERNEGTIEEKNVVIKIQAPKAVKLEQAFKGHFPIDRKRIDWEKKTINKKNPEYTFEFEGIGFVLTGSSQKDDNIVEDYVHIAEVYINEELTESVKLPTGYTSRRHDICWKYNLPKQKHKVTVKLTNPKPGYKLLLGDIIVYSDEQKTYDK
ncbi:hypothetical protein ES705_32965 [subsurface metagenome]